MKKLKLPLKKAKAKQEQPAGRITNETVAEHREKILAGGRRFKYPHQYVRHKLVINAIVLTLVVVIITSLVGWWQLYKAQNTSEFMYRTTRVLPLPVASVDGEMVRYSDYLMRYRSQELWLRTQGQLGLNGNDSQSQLDFIKRSVMDGLLADVYAQKLARELNLSASDEEIQAAIDTTRKTATGDISQSVYDASTQDTLGYSPSEYRSILRQSLLRQKVAFAVDKSAQTTRDQVAAAIKKSNKPSLEKIAETLKKAKLDVVFGVSGFVPNNNQDGGLSKTALSLKDGQVSAAIQSTSGDGYYFVQRLSGTDRQISYIYIKVPLTEFERRFAELKTNNKITEYIELKSAEPTKE